MTNKESTLLRYQDAYYNGKPLVGDDVYDALYDEVTRENPDSFVLKRVGATPKGDWPKAHHFIPMGSLNKANSIQEVEKWWPEYNVVLMDKLDGISLGIQYIDRRFVKAVTRGNGLIGDDITRNVSLMEGVLKNINFKGEVWIRGEIICKRSTFDTHFKDCGYENPRNTASGISKSIDDYEDCKYLTFMAYQIIGNPPVAKSKIGELTLLSNEGFFIPNFKPVRLKDVERIYNDYIDSIRASLDYDIDGLVLCVDNNNEFEGMGGTEKRPAGAIAFKFPHESKITVLRDIKWQVGNTGRITPVAFFDTVVLAGANVSQASMHTVDRVKCMKLYEGCNILVSRRNDCIPFLESNISMGISTDDLSSYEYDNKNNYFMPPETCPSCEQELSMRGEYLNCTNDQCPARVAGAINNWITKLNILEFGDSVINAVIEAGLVNDIGDLYLLDPDKVAALKNNGRFLGESGRKAVINLLNKKEITIEELIGSLGINLWGRSMVKVLTDAGYNTLEKLFTLSALEMTSVKGISIIKAKEFCNGLSKNYPLINKLISNGVTIKKNSGHLNGVSFCMTGFRDSALQEAIESKGGSIKSSVSKGLTYLIVLDTNSTSSKAEKARSLGTKIINVDEARNMI